MIIALSNSTVSFVSGFAVWAVVGFLEAKGSLAQTKTSSAGLAFIAYPTAVDLMGWPNFWAFFLGLTLFLLGVDSAFSMVEATATVVADIPSLKKVPRMLIAFIICMAGFIMSIPFCTNWGFVLFDVIDHYLCTYLLLLVGIFQCVGCGWGFDVERTLRISEKHALSLKYLTGSFWGFLFVVGLVFVLLEQVKIAIIVLLAGVPILCILPSFIMSGLPFSQWYAEIGMCGCRKIAYSMSKLSRKSKHEVQWWEPAFTFYFSLTIKYFIPCVLWVILVNVTRTDIVKPYGGYAAHWQAIGLCVPIIGLIAFLLHICFWITEEPLSEEEFATDLPGEDGVSLTGEGDKGIEMKENKVANDDL